MKIHHCKNCPNYTVYKQVEAGYASMKELLELTEVYSSETDYSVWTSVSTLMTKLEILLGHRPELVERLHGFGRKLYSEVFKGLGWDSKPDESKWLPVGRNSIRVILCHITHASVYLNQLRRLGFSICICNPAMNL